MILTLFSVLLLSAGGATAGSHRLATVRHFSMQPGQSWAVSITASAGTVSARLWWIEGPPAHTGFPEKLLRDAGLEEAELPAHIEARTVDLTTARCESLTGITADLRILATAATTTGALSSVRRTSVFTLEVPGSDPIDLDVLPPGHPLVRWARRAWTELSACAGSS